VLESQEEAMLVCLVAIYLQLSFSALPDKMSTLLKTAFTTINLQLFKTCFLRLLMRLVHKRLLPQMMMMTTQSTIPVSMI